MSRQAWRDVDPEQGRQGRKQIDPLDLIGATAARNTGSGNRKRHVEQLVVDVRAVQQQAVLLEFLAVVGGHDDHRRVAQPEPVEPREQGGQLGVPAVYLAIVESAEVLDLLGWKGRGRARPELA